MESFPDWMGNYGFPIAAFLLMYRLVQLNLSEQSQAIKELTLALVELREAILQVLHQGGGRK